MVVATLAVSACAPAASAPAHPVGDERPRTIELSEIPQPDLATIDLGSDGPGFDGSGDFYSYDSDLSPEATIGAYAGQLLSAGYREAGWLGSWRVFVGPVLTVWVRTGASGPPTSLLVRVQPTSAADGADPQPSAVAGDPRTPGPIVSGTTRQPSSATSRRPDPPHASTGATATGSGGSATDGTASGGSGGTVLGGTSSGTPTDVSGGTATGGSDGNGLTSR